MDIFWNFNFKKKGYFWSDECNYKEVERVRGKDKNCGWSNLYRKQ